MRKNNFLICDSCKKVLDELSPEEVNAEGCFFALCIECANNWAKDIPVWADLEELFIVGAGFPEKRYWNCEDNEDNFKTLKEILESHKVKFPKNASFKELKNIFRQEFRQVNLLNEVETLFGDFNGFSFKEEVENELE